jgi:hypothetical protein
MLLHTFVSQEKISKSTIKAMLQNFTHIYRNLDKCIRVYQYVLIIQISPLDGTLPDTNAEYFYNIIVTTTIWF